MQGFVKGGVIHGVSGMYGGATLPLQANEELVFGRGADLCHIVIADDTGNISRKHVSVALDSKNGSYIVTDFSSNGTFLSNGTRLLPNTPTRLPSGTAIYLANPQNSFLLGEQVISQTNTNEQYTSEGFLERYEDGGVTMFVCIAGIVTAIVALLTFSQQWVSIEMFSVNQKLTLLDVAGLSSQYSGATQMYDAFTGAGLTSTLGLISLAASVSYWILLIGGIVSIIVSVIILIWPKSELLVFIPAYITIAFAIIGAVFTFIPLFTNGLGFMPIPLLMLIVAGIPGAINKFLF